MIFQMKYSIILCRDNFSHSLIFMFAFCRRREEAQRLLKEALGTLEGQ